MLQARDGVAERGEDNAAEMRAELLKYAILTSISEGMLSGDCRREGV